MLKFAILGLLPLIPVCPGRGWTGTAAAVKVKHAPGIGRSHLNPLRLGDFCSLNEPRRKVGLLKG